MVKTPKLYFTDTGLLCHLLGIDNDNTLQVHPSRGEIVENFVITEAMKYYWNHNKDAQLYFYRDSNKVEVDLVDCSDALAPKLIEIKSGLTPRSEFTKSLVSVGDELGIPGERRFVVYGGSNAFLAKGGVAKFLPMQEYVQFAQM